MPDSKGPFETHRYRPRPEGLKRDIVTARRGDDDNNDLGLDLVDLDADADLDELDIDLGFDDLCLDDLVLDPGP